MNLDFADVALNYLNAQGYYAKVITPILANGNSISLAVLPTSDYQYYFDGSYRVGFLFEVLTKNEDQETAYDALVDIANKFNTLRNGDLPSQNDSYQFEGISITVSPAALLRDDKYYYYSAQFTAELFIPYP